jgi:alpha-1,6-mannosyltransferase
MFIIFFLVLLIIGTVFYRRIRAADYSGAP